MKVESNDSQRADGAKATALLLVPPLLKVLHGPLLGPAMLVGAARNAGHEMSVWDLNAQWLDEQRAAQSLAPDRSAILGDHDRPVTLRAWEARYHQLVAAAAELPTTAVKAMRLSHREAIEGARRLCHSALGAKWRHQLERRPTPQVVGISVLYAGQVLSAMALTMLAKSLWPRAVIVWGGPHVTALGEQIAADPEYGRLEQRFVLGYAERTWVDLLAAVARGAALPAEVFLAGSGTAQRAKEDGAIVPIFDDLARHEGDRVIIPAQTSRGCSYGKCTFCTYPSVEAQPRELPLAAADHAIELAVRHGGVVSFKDSFLTVDRLRLLAEKIEGRIQWSACTRLSRALVDALPQLGASGCATLEIGLETLTPDGQRTAHKRQSPAMLLALLDAAQAAGVALVLNYMMGFPGVERAEEEATLAELRREVAARPGLIAELELNELQLERTSPMGRDPAAFGLEVTERWPWSTVMAHRRQARPLVPLGRRR